MRLAPAVLILLGLGIYVGVTAVAAGVLQVLDLDGDGLSTWTESRHDTHPWVADSDLDGLSDGWEVQRGLPPLAADADADGLLDGAEIGFGSDPLSADTDGDGLPDAVEAPPGLKNADCDGDGRPPIREQDDDNDGRADAQEEPDQRCNPDVDGDGVLDGDEANPACVVALDCDNDGLTDLVERNLTYDPLDPDTFDAKLPDGVAYAFAQAGQAPGADDDDDGIPDPWEDAAGLIDWGPYDPSVQRRDLLVEFLRVLGPDSARHAVPLTGSYDLVAAAFDDGGVHMQWQETTVRLPTEPLPNLIPTRNSTYYRDLLDRARYADNPYVATVVINPQLDQSEIAHAGVAPLRGMLAAIDLSQFIEFTLTSDEPGFTVEIQHVSPYLESLIRAGRIDETAFDGGIHPDGSYYVFLEDSQTQNPAELRWQPFWYGSPRIIDDGVQVALRVSERNLETQALAHTILHELGHTLGLCHPHESTCYASLPAEDRARQAQSTMSYDSDDDTLHFLPSEWVRLRAFLQCPAPDPIQALADGQPVDVVLDAKYDYALESLDEISVRSCGDFAPVPTLFQPLVGAVTYDPPAERATAPAAPTNDATPSVAFWLGTVVVALVAGATPAAIGLAAKGRKFP